MFSKSFVSIAVISACTFTGCAATKSVSQNNQNSNTTPATELTVEQVNQNQSKEITIRQAMAHPDWIGRQPEQAYWSSDSSSIYYQRKQAGSELKDLYHQKIINTDTVEKVSIASLHQSGSAYSVYSKDDKYQAYTFEGDVFVRDLKTGHLQQITRSSEVESQLQFLNDGSLVYRIGHIFNKVDLTTGLTQEIANLIFNAPPKSIKEPESYLEKEQHKLIKFVALTHKNKKDNEQREQDIAQENTSRAPGAFYLGKDMRLVDAQLSPSGKFMLAATTVQTSWRSDSDIMPNYITSNGDIAAEKVRRRVSDSYAQTSVILLLDLETGEKTHLNFEDLPGFDQDVLAKVKTENYAKQGKTYESKPKERAINLMMDWTWSQSPIQWNGKGDQVAVMLEAWDNKDRWLASVDIEKKRLVSQHRLHDDAWINYTHNDFGWLKQSDELYFLSEESGYSQLYKKGLKSSPVALTQGNYVVSNIQATKDDKYLYFKANQKHPGIYEISRVNLATKEVEVITDLNGKTEYLLSPDDSKILLTHSKVMQPPELYVTGSEPQQPIVRLTHTVSEQFKNTKLIAPKIVAVPSTHTDQPIYARVYYPADYQVGETGNKRKAVIFNHGAGYLQNAHLGWSVYFREFMFHSFLAQQGYVVMDMDYRASKGYGRDWRTAIYRQMGTPEIEDLADGVNWMADNANIDVERVGTYGGSYGGFMTFMALMKQPDLFKAGAAIRPVSDWAYYNASYTSNILNHPDIDPIAYEQSSPIYFAEGLKNQLLINAPMVDDNVFFQDVVRLVQRLIELEKPNFETAIYPVEPHGFRQPSSWLDEYRRIYKLFEEKL